jgi:aspartate kinase
MSVVVQKFGGSSVADVPKLTQVAQKVVATRRAGEDVVVVISAMGKTTDQLLALAHEVDASPPRRELDMLLTTGERVSMALLSMAIQKLGCDAISFTGSQSGIMTNDRHFDARIIEVRPWRIEDELVRGRVVIVAGYQGMSYKREITTLGRGGSDTTAIALAAALGAERAEIYSDVDGVYSADPRVVPEARHLPELTYEEMQEMAEAGAKVLNSTAVDFARRARIAIHARSTFQPGRETVVRDGAAEAGGPAVVGQKDLALLRLAGADGLARILTVAEELGLSVRESAVDGIGARAVVARSGPDWARVQARLSEALPQLAIEATVGAVTLVARELGNDPAMMRAALAALGAEGIEPRSVTTAPLRWRALVAADRVDDAVRTVHRAVERAVDRPAG